MLVLARKAGEKILIGSDIEVEVLEVRGESVKLGITAPREIPVWRGELVLAVAEANRESLKVASLSMAEVERLLSDRSRAKKKEEGR